MKWKNIFSITLSKLYLTTKILDERTQNVETPLLLKLYYHNNKGEVWNLPYPIHRHHQAIYISYMPLNSKYLLIDITEPSNWILKIILKSFRISPPPPLLSFFLIHYFIQKTEDYKKFIFKNHDPDCHRLPKKTLLGHPDTNLRYWNQVDFTTLPPRKNVKMRNMSEYYYKFNIKH